jgi:pyridoxal phosphate enzyme (YggS family)
MRSIHENLQAVRERVVHAVAAAGRAPGSVTLLAVSKTHPPAQVEQAMDAGQAAFGENYVQEALDKMDALAARRAEWHLVGPLQSNKTRPVAARFAWVHSIESEKVARRLSEQRPAALPPLNVLIQVNVSGEASKSGVAPDAAVPLALAVASLPGLRLRGLMAIPEPTADLSLQKNRFAKVRTIFEEIKSRGIPVDTLSMGMSDDMEAAIAEGSTMVRIGTAIFGQRKKIRPAA